MKMRGRPAKSEVRYNIAAILAVKGPSYGYELAKLYLEIFPKVSKRLIYYHLHKGVELNEFEIDKVKSEEGSYSWGRSAEKTYYKLGEKAKIINKKSVLDFLNKTKKEDKGVN